MALGAKLVDAINIFAFLSVSMVMSIYGAELGVAGCKAIVLVRWKAC